MNRIYRVWGEDTFAHESYLVGEYKTREEAEAKLQECKLSVLDQCKELRDTFWISEMTEEDIHASNARAEERREERRRARECDSTMLEEDITSLITDIRLQLNNKHLTFNRTRENDNHDAVATRKNPSSKVCYHAIVFYADSYDTGNCNINTAVYAGGYMTSGAIKFAHSEAELKQWLNSPECIKESIDEINKLIDMFFDN